MDTTSNKSNDEFREKTESSLNNISIKDNDSNNNITSTSNHYNDFFENFKQSMQNITNVMKETWPSSFFPTLKIFSPFEWMDKWTDTRLPLCDVTDKGDKYEVNLEIPGIDKDKINVNATKNSLSFRISISKVQRKRQKLCI